jgi:hypothetical protein
MGYILCLFIGAIIGFTTSALCVAAGRNDVNE